MTLYPDKVHLTKFSETELESTKMCCINIHLPFNLYTCTVKTLYTGQGWDCAKYPVYRGFHFTKDFILEYNLTLKVV